MLATRTHYLTVLAGKNSIETWLLVSMIWQDKYFWSQIYIIGITDEEFGHQ